MALKVGQPTLLLVIEDFSAALCVPLRSLRSMTDLTQRTQRYAEASEKTGKSFYKVVPTLYVLQLRWINEQVIDSIQVLAVEKTDLNLASALL